MNAPIPRILIESMWRGRLFGAQWRPAIGGSLDVLEPATGAVITRVGNATAEDVRQAAAEARAAQPGWAATPYDERAAILRKAQEERGLSPSYDLETLSALQLPEEMDLLKRILHFPELVASAAQTLEPHRVVFYLQETIAAFHAYYTMV